MAKNKTVETTDSVKNYLAAIVDGSRKKDCEELARIMEKASGFPPKMWGSAIVGFGRYEYKYDSGHEGEAPLAGFSSRAGAISLYLSSGFPEREKLLEKFGKFKSAKACLYIKKLGDIDQKVLEQLVRSSVKHMQKLHHAKK